MVNNLIGNPFEELSSSYTCVITFKVTSGSAGGSLN